MSSQGELLQQIEQLQMDHWSRATGHTPDLPTCKECAVKTYRIAMETAAVQWQEVRDMVEAGELTRGVLSNRYGALKRESLRGGG